MSISHELRTPLTAITGWGETLIYNEDIDSETRRGISIILKEARRLTKMVEELLEFTRMEDGRFTRNVEQIDVGAVLEDSIFAYRELLHQDGIELEYDPCMDDVPLISGDQARLKQVFMNLFDNAAKYGKSGGRITVSMELEPEAVCVRVRDYGPGIPEDELQNVKKKFYKGSNAKERGSGIGLAVCDEIVNFHGGSLILENAQGGGCWSRYGCPSATEKTNTSRGELWQKKRNIVHPSAARRSLRGSHARPEEAGHRLPHAGRSYSKVEELKFIKDRYPILGGPSSGER
jgi:signal transduction histidine kinase